MVTVWLCSGEPSWWKRLKLLRMKSGLAGVKAGTTRFGVLKPGFGTASADVMGGVFCGSCWQREVAEQWGGGYSEGQSPFPTGAALFYEQICTDSREQRRQTRVPPNPPLPAPLDVTGSALTWTLLSVHRWLKCLGFFGSFTSCFWPSRIGKISKFLNMQVQEPV